MPNAAVALLQDKAPHHHLVEFYENDAVLCDHVAEYLAEGLAAGEPVIAVATAAHRPQIEHGIAARGHDLAAAIATGQLALLDAHATLASFSDGDQPIRARFFDILGDALTRLRAGRADKKVRAFGEMVDLLWRAGKRQQALALEGYWNELAGEHQFSLLCAYVMGNFYKAADRDDFMMVCNAHTHVIPSEREAALAKEVAQRKELENALRDVLASERALREQAERNLKFNEMFAAMLGHDLRNPLSTVTIGAAHIAKTSVDTKARGAATRIVSSAERMGRMVDQLLDLTRIRVGSGFTIARQRLDLAELWRKIADENGVMIGIETHGDTAGEWDADRLAQAASNLVHNAYVHGTPDKPITVAIDGREPGRVATTIHNYGAIPGDMIPIIFEPFRGSHQKRASSRGLGLGLYITQQIVAAHAGTIEVRSSDGEGTTFHVCLPRGV